MIQIKPDWLKTHEQRMALSVWHELDQCIRRSARVLEQSMKRPDLASFILEHADVFERYCEMHMHQILNGNNAGDSAPHTEHVASTNGKHVDTALTAQAFASGQAPVFERCPPSAQAPQQPEKTSTNGAASDGSHVSTNHASTAQSVDQADVAAELAKDIEEQLSNAAWVMGEPGYREQPPLDQQRFEVARAKLYRARGHLRASEMKQALRQFNSAVALISGRETEYAEG